MVDKTLIHIIRGNVRETDQLIGDIYASSDGYSHPVLLKTKASIEKDRILLDFEGTSGLDKKGINCPLVHTKAYSCYALECAIAPEIPNNAAGLAPFEVVALENSIVNAKHPAPVELRHVIGHMVPDAVYAALDQLFSNLVPAEGARCLCNFQVSLRPRSDIPLPSHAKRSEVLTFNLGGSGACPTLDGMNATAFPSGVMAIPIEATEQVGPVIIWRKELRPDSGGAGRFRGGLGQFMEVGAQDGCEFDIQAMFDRVHHPANGRLGGDQGSPTTIALDDGTAMKGKGKQFVPHGARVQMAFPGGAGYGPVDARDPKDIKGDLARGHISRQAGVREYGLSAQEADDIELAVQNGEAF